AFYDLSLSSGKTVDINTSYQDSFPTLISSDILFRTYWLWVRPHPKYIL
ncbi:unnamed protein product, partial [marine sediment metagenome]